MYRHGASAIDTPALQLLERFWIYDKMPSVNLNLSWPQHTYKAVKSTRSRFYGNSDH